MGPGLIAGIVDVIGLLGFEHEAISHLIGTTSLLAAALIQLDLPRTLHFGALIGAFVIGAVLSGVLIQSQRAAPGSSLRRRLARAFAAAFRVGAAARRRQRVWHVFGGVRLRPAERDGVSTYSGAVVRTTHLSGMFTDLGIFLGHTLRGLPVETKRLWLCVLVITDFLCGGMAGTLGFRVFGYAALLFPAGLTAVVGVTYGPYAFKVAVDDKRMDANRALAPTNGRDTHATGAD